MTYGWNSMKTHRTASRVIALLVIGLLLTVVHASVGATEQRRADPRQRADERTERPTTRDMRLRPLDRDAERLDRLPEKDPQQPDPDERQPALGIAALDRVIDRAEYRLGPGDVLLFSIIGSTAPAVQIPVTPDGRLIVPEFGPVDVAGMTLNDAEQRVSETVGDSYANAEISLSIVRIRQFRVHVSGLVEYPGSYIATGAQRVSDMIVKAGGLKKNASYRRIVLHRTDGERIPIDLNSFLNSGDRTENPTLDMGDVIVIPGKGQPVVISGAVSNPGEYEYRPDDTVERLIAVAGGLTDYANTSRIEWTTSSGDDGKPVLTVVDLAHVLTDARLNASVRAQDHIFIPPRTDSPTIRTVTVEGKVSQPGTYSIIEGETRLSDVIQRAGGVTSSAFLRGSYVIRVPAEPGADREFDRLTDAMEKMGITREEGRFYRARGRQMFGVLAIDFEKALNSPGSRDDALLLDGDEIVVADPVETVEVFGQVAHPGHYRYEPGLTYSDYIELAGGPSWRSRTKKIRLIEGDTGNWIRPDADTPVYAGDRIFVPQAEDVNYWVLTKDIVGLTAQLATVVLLIVTIAD